VKAGCFSNGEQPFYITGPSQFIQGLMQFIAAMLFRKTGYDHLCGAITPKAVETGGIVKEIKIKKTL
jgi:hypothetical protein